MPPVSATRGTEWTERPPSRAFVDLLFFSFLFFSLCFLVIVIAPCSTRHILQEATPDGYDLRVPIMALPAFTAPPLFSYLSSFLYPTHVVSRSQTVFTSTKQLSRGMRMRIRPSYFILPFMCLYSLYSITITGVPEVTYNADLRDSTHVYKTAVLLVEEGIDPNQEASPVFSLISFSATALWNRSLSQLISVASALSTDISSLSPSALLLSVCRTALPGCRSGHDLEYSSGTDTSSRHIFNTTTSKDVCAEYCWCSLLC